MHACMQRHVHTGVSIRTDGVGASQQACAGVEQTAELRWEARGA